MRLGGHFIGELLKLGRKNEGPPEHVDVKCRGWIVQEEPSGAERMSWRVRSRGQRVLHGDKLPQEREV